MTHMKTIYKKEFNSYFVSPIAYVVIFIFLAVIGSIFFETFFSNNQASLTRFFVMLPMAFAFIIPAVTMRLFSEEINIGSYEILLTLPINFKDIIMGKFLAAISFMSIMLAPTLLYAITTMFFGKLDWGPVIGGYVGAILLASAFCAIGLLASSLTRNQVLAFMIGMTICFFLTLLVDFFVFFMPAWAVNLFQYLSANYHFQSIAKGVIDSRDIIYFLSLSFVSLYVTNLIMSEKK